MPGSALIGNLAVNLSLQTAAFQKGLDIAQKRLAAFGGKMGELGGKMQSIGKNMTAFVTTPLAGLAAAGIKEAEETAKAMGQVTAALTSMGPVAGRTAGQLQAAANAFEGSSLFEADEILSKVTANMLTFGNVAGEQFDRAQQAAINVATRMGTDLQSAAVMVGKALNDPIRGLTSLTRVGIQFTDQQKEQIKAMTEAGNVAGAQKIILGELERQFGGAAKAAQDADPFNKTADAFKNMAEAIGTALLPLIPPLTDAIIGVLNAFTSLSPETQKWILIVGGAAAVIGPVVGVIGTLVTGFGALIPLVVKLGPLFTVLRTAMLALLGNPVLLGAAVVIVGIYEAWKHWDEISAIVQRVYAAVKTWIVDKLNAVWDWVTGKIQAVTNAFKRMYDLVVGHSYVPDMVDGIARSFAELQRVMVDPAASASDKVAAIFQNLQGVVGQVFGSKAGGILGIIGQFATALAPALFPGTKAPATSAGSSATVPTTGFVGPRLASGGHGVFGGMGGVDKNILGLNGSPIAWVSKGEPFSIGGQGGGPFGRIILELRDEMLEARIASGANVQIIRAAPALRADAVHAVTERERRR